MLFSDMSSSQRPDMLTGLGTSLKKGIQKASSTKEFPWAITLKRSGTFCKPHPLPTKNKSN